MKTIKSLLLFALCCWGLSANAQTLCGISQPYFYWVNNPNNVPVFHDTSTYASGWAPVSYVWDFGDGTSSTQPSPSHVFANPGNYNVCMYVTAQLQGSAITCTDTFCKMYSNCNGAVVATFNAAQQGNGIVQFTGSGSSNYPPLVFTWDFGDGSSGTGASPVHTYSTPGSYIVCLNVTDANGCSGSYCQAVTVTSSVCGNINASFTITNPTQGTVVLSNSSSGTTANTLYQWWMDGTALTNPTPNTAYTVTNVSAGYHTFCLYVYANNNTFCDSSCVTYYVQSGTNPCAGVNASFTYNSGNGSLSVASNSTGVPAGAMYQWYLNGTATPLAPTYLTYSWSNLPAGTYDVCLYIWGSNQQWCDSTCQTVIVQNSNPCLGIYSQFTHTMQGNTGTFIPSSNTVNVTHVWTVNHNPVGTSPNLTYTFPTNPNAVTYTVCHTVSLPGTNCSDSTCVNITIPGSNNCNLQAAYTYTNQGNLYTFTGTYANTAGYTNIWTINGTAVATTGTFTYTFPSGTNVANVCYIVSIPGTICSDTACMTITVNPGNCQGVTADIVRNINPNGGGVDLSVLFTGSTTATYTWSNGATTPTITVATSGFYCVTVVDINGCSATDCDSVDMGGCSMQSYIGTSNSSAPWVLQAYVFGGTAPYTYVWSNGASNSNILTVTAPGTYCVTIYDALQCSATACYNVGNTTNHDTICGVVFEDLNGNGVQDNNESGFVGGHIYIGNYSAFVDSFGHYWAVVPAGTYTVWYCAPQGYTFTIPVNSPNPNGTLANCASYTVTTTGGSLCGFNFGIVNNNATICGTVYFDADNDHTQDVGENGIPNVHVYVSGNGATYHAYTDQNGDYCVLVPAGTYTATIGSNTIGGTVTPTSISVTVTTGGVFGNNDFGIYTPPGSCNLSIDITPHTTITAGFPAWYDIEVCNMGGNIASGTVNMFYDASLTFSNSSPAQTSHNASTHTLTWALTNLLPGQCEYYWVDFDANTNITIGQFAFTLANVITNGCQDINMANNVDTIHQNVTGSWDPNNKLAYVTNYEPNPAFQTVSSQNGDQRIEYVVNFQNTGTAPAVNVVVEDLISSDLDINSFELLGASHPMTATLNGNHINFKFSSIMLPDSTSDEPNSHGFVRFAINAVNGLPGGHVISDDAAIYFDYNAPVITNDAAVTMLDASGIEETGSVTTVVVAPNPMSSYTIFKVSGASNGFKLRIHDMTGRMVSDEISNSNTLMFEKHNLSTGVYSYQVIQGSKVSAKGKLVIE